MIAVGPAIFLISIFLELYLFIIRTKSLSRGILYSYISAILTATLTANLFSVFKRYDLTFVLLVLLIKILVYLRSLWHTTRYKSERNLCGIIRFRLSSLSKLQWTVLGMIIIAICCCTYRAFIYPPRNTDSIVYHLPRAFYFYKAGMVTNIPSSYIVMNYTSPLSEILESYLLILMNGSDRLVNFIQFPMLFVIPSAVRQICQILKVNQILTDISALFSISIPLVILQSVTTQNDLLSAGFTLMAVLFFLDMLCTSDIKHKNCLLFGVCGGLAVYSKITAAATLLPFAMVFCVMLIKRRNIKSVVISAEALVAGGLINLPYWARNAMDWEGDFLALKASTYMSPEIPPSFGDYMGRIVFNIGYCLGGRSSSLNQKWISFLRKLYLFIGADECSSWGWSVFFVSPAPQHDSAPYGIMLLLMGIFAVIVFVLGTRSAKVYSLCWCTAMLATALMTKAFVPSVARYMMPAVIAGAPIVFLGAQIVWGKIKWVHYLMIASLTAVSISNLQFCNIFDTKQPLLIKPVDYDTVRSEQYGPYGWNKTAEQFVDRIDDRNLTKIAIYEEVICGIYPMLLKLKDSKYEVFSIYGEFAQDYVPKGYVPEAIIYVGERDLPKEKMSYHGRNYYLEMSGDYLSINDSQAYLYLLE